MGAAIVILQLSVELGPVILSLASSLSVITWTKNAASEI